MNFLSPGKDEIKAFLSTIKIMILDYISRPFYLLQFTIAPFVFSLTALILYSHGNVKDYGFYIIMGSGLIGMWASTVSGGGMSIQLDRWMGMLPVLLRTPVNIFWINAGKNFVNSIVGIITLFEIIIISILFFNISIKFTSIFYFIWGLLFCFISFSVIGLFLSGMFVLTRNSVAWANGLSRFLYIFSGAIFPLSVLPPFFRYIAYALPTTWSINILKLSFYNVETISNFKYSLIIFIFETIIYLSFAIYFYVKIDYLTRKTGEFERM